MKKNILLPLAVFVLVGLYSLENRSQRLDVESPPKNWNSLAHQDLQRLKRDRSLERNLNNGEQEHMYWVAKASRFLRGGKALSKKDDLKKLLKLSQVEVVDLFTSDPAFYDSVLDYNMYFLGFTQPYVKNHEGYNPNIYSHKSAIQSAVAVAKGEDYFKILDLYPPSVVLPLNPVSSNFTDTFPHFPQPEKFNQLTDIEKRRAAITYFSQTLEDMAKKVEVGAINVETACGEFAALGISSLYYTLGFPYSGFGEILREEDSDYYNTCYTLPIVATELPFLRGYVKKYSQIASVMDEYDAQNYVLESLKNVKSSPFASAQTAELQFSQYEYARSLPNSSTNMNRKRAAYILSKFFCDDLTPINVETPDEHTGGVHGSDTSCYACHYKLDPMAGFFKDNGYFFYSVKDPSVTEITFDDGAVANKDEYQKAWLAAPSAGMKWNIGYVRSEKNPQLNNYGETLEDLFQIIKNSYEYKRCVVKRLFRYATDNQQVMDAGYIEKLSQTFDKDSIVNSASAITDLFKTVALSKTFSQEDRHPATCYDVEGGITSSLPCQVRFVLEKNCMQCHDATMSFSSLDLTSWIEVAPGVNSFYHLDEQGKSLSKTESLSRILDRITTNDPKKRMPKKIHMDPSHREQLFQWLNSELQQ
jgi:hypothetical protein